MSRSTGPVAWASLTLAVVGGDEREPEIARLAAATGATVRAFGFPWPAEGVMGVELAGSARAATTGADYVLLPIPRGSDGNLYAPDAPEPIPVGPELFAALAPRAQGICGRITDELSAAAAATGVTLHEYDPDKELMLLRGPAIVEGALAAAIEHTDVTIHGAEVCVVGFGTIGQILVRTLIGLGARVHVAARNPVQRAGAYALGATAHELGELAELAPSLSMVFSTVPARVVDAAVLQRLPLRSLVLDIAPPPDHADLEEATHLGHRAVWARGLGKRAPITVGASQWMGLRRRIEEIEAGGGRAGPPAPTEERSLR